MKEYKVLEEDAGIRLDRWFKRNKPDMPHSMLSKMLRKGQVRVGGKKIEANYRVAEGDLIQIRGQEPAEKTFQKKEPENKAKPILNPKSFNDLIIFENNDYVIINKPHGLASQGGRGITISVDDMIRGISERYKLVHRLDKDTSGVLAIAKKTSAAAKFSELLKNKKMNKIYWALVKGLPPKQKGVIKLALAKRGEKMEKVEVDLKEGKSAVTEYVLLESLASRMSWLQLSPITGRTHQLRVHCAAIGCPIIGDGKYGGTESFIDGVSNKLHLHARRLIIPELGIDVTAKLPKHMEIMAPDV